MMVRPDVHDRILGMWRWYTDSGIGDLENLPTEDDVTSVSKGLPVEA